MPPPGHRISWGPTAPFTPEPVAISLRRSVRPAWRTEHPSAWRLDITQASAAAGPLTWQDVRAGEITATPEVFGDVVIARKDVPTSYHLACTWDDAQPGITLVTRGIDLFPATHIHRLLQALLGLPTPRYDHHPLILGPDGRKFSKRDKAPTLRALRDAGRTPDEVIAMAGCPPHPQPPSRT